MAQNRYLPYGYKIENGKTAIEPQEAEIIRRIYRQYADGLSYLKIAEELTKAGVRYMPDKPQWNKNMVARILQNPNYLGTEKYPSIVESGLSHAARQMAKPYTHTVSGEIKAVKPLLRCDICGERLKRRLKAESKERWYCPTDTEHIAISVTDAGILQDVQTLMGLLSEEAPARAKKPICNEVSTQAIRLQNEIDRLLEQTSLNVHEIQNKITELAAERYRLCEDIENALPSQGSQGFHTETLAKKIESIQISHNKVIALVLKNGKIIKEGDTQNE